MRAADAKEVSLYEQEGIEGSMAAALVVAMTAGWEEETSSVEVLRRASAKRSASSAEKSRRWEAMGLEVRASSCEF